jgi:hypothetical protein
LAALLLDAAAALGSLEVAGSLPVFVTGASAAAVTGPSLESSGVEAA